VYYYIIQYYIAFNPQLVTGGEFIHMAKIRHILTLISPGDSADSLRPAGHTGSAGSRYLHQTAIAAGEPRALSTSRLLQN